MKTKIILWLWRKYHCALWCLKAYVVNPLIYGSIGWIERAFEEADWQVRKLVRRWIS